jgi:hypothetical protein
LFEGEKEVLQILPSYFHILRHQLAKFSKLKDPLVFYRSPQYGGVTHPPLAAAAIQILRPVAAMYLAFQSGSSQVERGFSFTGWVLSKRRLNMNEDTLRFLLLIRSWAQQPGNTFESLVKLVQELTK